MSRPTDPTAARKFAVRWATSPSSGDIANLARAYLRVSHDNDVLVVACQAALEAQMHQGSVLALQLKAAIAGTEPPRAPVVDMTSRRAAKGERQ